MKLRATKKHLFCGALLLAAMAFVGYGVVEPDSSAGYAVFRVGYSLPIDPSAFLGFYQRSLREFNGRGLPESVDEFLVTRLSDSSTAERRAIIDFQISQKSSRWSERLCHIHDDLKRQMIADIFSRLDTFPPDHAVDALVLVESMRRNDPIHKGGFSELDMWTHDGTAFNVRADRLAVAKDSFRRWWADGNAWPANKSQDPLKGTGLVIHDGP